MEEKKYLKWYNKVGYGSGDIAGNVVYAFLTSFVMIYLTETVGLASGMVGTLIAFSKLLDGFTDVFFGSLIDKTHSKLGKARPWMLYGYIGCAVTLVACFAVPTSLGKTAQYTWFFLAYTLLNGIFYTANNIAYSALTSLITKNSKAKKGTYASLFPQINASGAYQRTIKKQVMYMDSDSGSDEEGGGGMGFLSSLGPYFMRINGLSAKAGMDPVKIEQTEGGSGSGGFAVGRWNTYNYGVSASMPIVNAQLWESLKISGQSVDQIGRASCRERV